MEFPFELDIRRKKVKYMRLRVGADATVSLTLPWYVPKSKGIAFVREKIEWINEMLKKKDERRKREFSYAGNEYALLPDHTLFPETVRFEGENIRIAAKNRKEAGEVFQKYLCQAAKKTIPEEMAALSAKHSFWYRKLTFRSQKTRWGSCSHRKDISLNIALMKLPKDLREYVLLHELCHTKEMNHSRKFWDLVAACCPKYREYRKELKRYGLSLS